MSGLSGGLIEGKGKFVKRGVGKDSSSQKRAGQEKTTWLVFFYIKRRTNQSINQMKLDNRLEDSWREEKMRLTEG